MTRLKIFYQSALGRVTAQLIRRQITTLWPETRGMDVMGLGYAVPCLDLFRYHSRRVISIMPAAQGVIHWPRRNANRDGRGYKGNLTALAHDDSLPVQDAAIDRIIMLHILEHSDQSRALLREVWRVLAPGGRVIVVVPNRLGLWARTDRTPFGYGSPFSALQLRLLLSDNMLSPVRTLSALHLPPFKHRSLLSLLTSFERLGQRWWHNLAGVLI
ncbi:MAG: class I SAM-dependent methyltransferase, partial [Alphaproteobacteria bacterium]|nr:class I SAM-dependent methyltransferase [Alphaproteobacteria bacterium]